MINSFLDWLHSLPWPIIFQVGYWLYVSLIVVVSAEIILNARSVSKALAYLAVIALLPIVGVVFYLSFGINYRKRKMYTRKIWKDIRLANLVEKQLEQQFKTTSLEHVRDISYFFPLAQMIQNDSKNIFSSGNKVSLLLNGEAKFPQILADLRNAKDHIHIEYYIFEDDVIGNEIAEILIQKHKEGVAVKFIYDDFGSSNIRHSLIYRLNEAGVPNFPFYKIKWIALANRLNYRNHRKIVIIDRTIGYVGGINVSDKYINKRQENHQYWRDTHLRLEGLAVLNLQIVFLSDWQFCSDSDIEDITQFFPKEKEDFDFGEELVQVVASGPDSNFPSILFAINRAILLSKKSVWITTPYFIPDETLTNALTMAALSGLDVRLLVPGISDSRFVNSSASSHYEELLEIGVRIFRYQKGFVHAKTMICDSRVAFIGTANLDQRSFDLNFEVNAVVYNVNLAQELEAAFLKDLESAEEIDLARWLERPAWKRLTGKVLNLFSPLM